MWKRWRRIKAPGSGLSRMRPKIIFFILMSLFLLRGHVMADVKPEWISAPQESSLKRFGDSRHVDISEDGRFVVFQSKATLTKEDKDKLWDIYLFDRKLKKLEKLSFLGLQNSNGWPSLSGDGRYVAFHSYPYNVVQGKPPRTADIFLFDRKKNRYEKITRPWGKGTQDGESLCPDLSGKGSQLVFSSNATELLEKKKAAFRAVYFYERGKKPLQLVSANKQGEPANRPSLEPKISEDGRFVLFKSAATNLEPPLLLNNLTYHLYLWDRYRRTKVRLDTTEYGIDFSGWMIGQTAIDAHARTIVFEGYRKNADDPMKTLTSSDLFVFLRRPGIMKKITDRYFNGHAHSPAVSGDGRYIAFVFRGFGEDEKGGLVILDQKLDAIQKILSGECDNPVFSKDGRFVAFESPDPALRGEEKKAEKHIFVVKNPFKR